MSETTKQRVTLTLASVSKEVTVEQFSPGTLWYVCSQAVLCKFPTGSKLHTVRHALVQVNQKGQWFFREQVVHNHYARAVKWADEIEGAQHGSWEVQERKTSKS